MYKNILAVLTVFLVICLLSACAPVSQPAATATLAPVVVTTPTSMPTQQPAQPTSLPNTALAPVVVTMPPSVPTQQPAQPTLVPNIAPTPATLLPDTLYLGTTSDGQDGVFLTNSLIQQAGGDANSGVLTFSDGQHVQPFNFNDLKNPQQFYSMYNPGAEAQILEVTNFTFDPERQHFYFSIVVSQDGQGGKSVQVLVQKVVSETPGWFGIWANDIVGGAPKYGDHQGNVYIDQAKGDYLVIRLMPCYACGGSNAPGLVIVLNATTRAEKALGLVANVSINLDQKNVSYQTLEPAKIACQPSPGCGDDGYMTTYQPIGTVLSEPLP